MIPFYLLAVGLLLIFCEFYVPGAIVGSLGVLVILSSIVVFALQYESPLLTLLFIGGVAVGLVLLFKYTLWRIRYGKPGSGIYSENNQEGFAASSYDRNAIGKIGVVLTDLKPGGHIVVEGKKHPALSKSGYLAKGSQVIVTGGEGESLTVKLYRT